MLIYLGSFSRFYADAPLLFFLGLGLFQTYVAGLLNISSTAQIKFQYLYWEPVAYAGILYLDRSRAVESSATLVALYGLLAATILVKYGLFLRSVIEQLTRHLGISLLWVKDKTK